MPRTQNYGQAPISGNGEVVGLYQPNCGLCGENGFSYIGGSVVTIPDIFNGGVNWYFSGINDLGQAVGSAGGGSFSYSNGVFSNLATPSPPDGINDSGEIIGCAYQASYSYVNGVTTPLAVPGGSGTCPTAINNTGTIVGYYSNNGAEQGFIDVGGAFTAFTVPGAYATYVNGINDDGVLLGTYDTSSGTFGFIATPVSNTSSVPEPASLVILGTGAFALSVATRSGRRRQSVDLGHSDDT